MILLYDFSMHWNKLLVKKKIKSIYFKFIWFYDFYALVTKGLKWLTVSITLFSGYNKFIIGADWYSSWFGCLLYIYTLLNKIESTLRKIKVSTVF